MLPEIPMGSTLDMWALVVGFFMPLLIEWWKSRAGFLARWQTIAIVVVSSAVVAAPVVLMRGGLDWSNWFTTALVLILAAVSAYEMWWKGRFGRVDNAE